MNTPGDKQGAASAGAVDDVDRIPGDKQGAASAGAVDDVDRIVLMIIHCFAWLISPRIGCIR